MNGACWLAAPVYCEAIVHDNGTGGVDSGRLELNWKLN